MAKTGRVYRHIVGIGVLDKYVVQGLPSAALVYLYLCLYALVACIVGEAVHRDAHLLTADLQTRILGVVQRLTALNGNVYGYHLHVAKRMLAGSVANFKL